MPKLLFLLVSSVFPHQPRNRIRWVGHLGYTCSATLRCEPYLPHLECEAFDIEFVNILVSKNQ
jgi:hypothetical protein